jgi:hypothetical protein
MQPRAEVKTAVRPFEDSRCRSNMRADVETAVLLFRRLRGT